jgi:dethiobiotin synthetase
MKKFFIIGTDTDCGKTYVTCQLIDFLKNRGHHVLGIKPLASGCVELNGVWVSEDARQLELHNGVSHPESLFLRLKNPVSPHIAAKEDGVHVSVTSIKETCQPFESQQDLDYLLIEGAGGLMVPLNAEETWVDFLQATKIPVILVVGMRLGCLNHALLTEAVLKSQNIQCAGWIANCIDPDMLALSENMMTLQHKMSFPLLATVPFKSNLQGTKINV